jgi:AcrR family transcriptional regulator
MAKRLADFTLDDVADTLGVTKPAIYHYFPNREALMRAAVAEGQLEHGQEKARIEARLEAMEPGPQRELLELKVRQIETALHVDGLLSSAGRPSRRTEPA